MKQTQLVFELAAAIVIGGVAACSAFAATDITVNDTLVFPESITALANGTVFFGSKPKPIIYRATPGADKAEPWIHITRADVSGTLGVLADPRSKKLWACALDPPATAPMTQRHTLLLSFDLRSGRPNNSYPLSGANNLCNDIAISPKGIVYVSDTYNGRVFRLHRGRLEAWLSDPLLAGIDGMTFVGETFYVNNILTGHIYRVHIDNQGKPGGLVDIALSRPLGRPDGMRAQGQRVFVAENGTGKVSELKIEGDHALVVELRDGFSTPTAVQPIGQILWVGESKLRFFNDPKLRGQDPGPFKAYAVPIP